MRRGVGGGGSWVRLGSGDGVRDRENKFERLGKSCSVGIDKWDCGGVTGSWVGGAGVRLITSADSARRVSPI